MNKKITIKFIILIFINIILFNKILNAQEVYIKTTVDNKIITNLDIENEYRYLLALNNDLKDLEKEKILQFAEKSLIREIIKFNEISKFIKPDFDDPFIIEFFNKFWMGRGFVDKNNFIKYLNEYDLTYNNTKRKIAIEFLWNELVQTKFRKQLNIDEDDIRKKVKLEVEKNKKFLITYKLSEIVFQANDTSDYENKNEKINKSIIRNGFKNTANLYSVSNSAKIGGDIGWVDESQLSKKVSDELKKIDIGNHTNTINLSSSFLILKIEEKKDKKVELDKEKLFQEKVLKEQQDQLGQYSLLYFNKLKLNSIINEK